MIRRNFLLSAAAASVSACATRSTTPDAVRSVRDNVLTSRERPAIRLAIDSSFRGLPVLRFPIADLTNAERWLFVDAGRNNAIRRMVMLQFETVQPTNSEFRFRFASNPPRQFGAETYRFNSNFYNDASAAAAMPDREPALTRAYLRERGYSFPDRWLMSRLARVSDAEGMTEVIIFYLEDASARPWPSDVQNSIVPLAPEEAEALFARLQAAVRVLEG
jgi:hypothetical protein